MRAGHEGILAQDVASPPQDGVSSIFAISPARSAQPLEDYAGRTSENVRVEMA